MCLEYYGFDLFCILSETDGEVGPKHHELELCFVLCGEVLGDLIHNAVVAEGPNELVSGGSQLRLEKREPEDARLVRLERLAHLLCLILVDHVLEINLVEVVGPGVQDLEALVFHVLCAVALHIGLNELIARLERDHRVLQVILFDLLLGVLQKV
jgi:hypothetical protein